MAVTEVRPQEVPPGAEGLHPRRHPIMAWLTTTDHKKIGVMYLVNSYFWFALAGLAAVFSAAPEAIVARLIRWVRSGPKRPLAAVPRTV